MKFNFEKAKNVFKKTAIGAGVVATSFSSLESNAQEAKKDIAENKIETSVNPEFYRNQYIKYMEHPSYKKRLAKEMYGDLTINKEMQKNIDIEFSKRLDKIDRIPISMIPNVKEKEHDPSIYSKHTKDDITIENVTTTPHAANHELTHATHDSIYAGFESIKNKYIEDKELKLDSTELEIYKNKHQEFIKILNEYLIKNKENIRFTIPDEYIWEKETAYNFILSLLNTENSKNFDMQKFFEYFNLKDINIIYNEYPQLIKELESFEKIKEENKINNYVNNYFRQSTEIKARLNHLRMRAVNEFGYDMHNELDINKFQELKNDRQYKELKEKLNLSDEQINELMKYVAVNQNNDKGNGDTYYHPGLNYNKEDQA